MSLLQSLFDHCPENRWKNEFRFWVAQSGLAPHALRRVSPLVGYEYLREIRKGDIVVDAGAFTGDYTVYSSRKVGPTGRVIAFEPDPQNLLRLRSNLKGELDNVVIVEKGLWSSDGDLAFRTGTQGFASGATDFARSSGKGHDICVPVIRLDHALATLGLTKVDILKMDIEGAEIEALQGAEQTLRQGGLHLCIATYHILEGHPTSTRVETLLRSWGYESVSGFANHLTTYGWKPEKRETNPSTP